MSDSVYDWEIDVDPEGTNDGRDYDGISPLDDETEDTDDDTDDEE